jgi:hypothetical protein
VKSAPQAYLCFILPTLNLPRPALYHGYVEDAGELRTPLAAIFNTGVIKYQRMLKMVCNKAATEREPEAWTFHPPAPSAPRRPPSRGYVEDCGEPRTQLAAIFNIEMSNIEGRSKRSSSKAASESKPEA